MICGFEIGTLLNVHLGFSRQRVQELAPSVMNGCAKSWSCFFANLVGLHYLQKVQQLAI